MLKQQTYLDIQAFIHQKMLKLLDSSKPKNINIVSDRFDITEILKESLLLVNWTIINHFKEAISYCLQLL